MEKLFEKAAKFKMRFSTAKGDLMVEDLYDLPLTSANGVSLDGIAKNLNRELKDIDEESFVEQSKPNPQAVQTEIKFELVKHIIADRLEVKKAKEERAERKERKEKLLRAIAAKQDQSLEQASLEELQQMVEELDA